METPQVYSREGMTGPHDLTKEAWREYLLPGGDTYKITLPVALYVRRKELGDSHRVLDAAGIVHYVPERWTILRWQPKTPADPVQF